MESLSMQLQPFFEWLLRTTLQASLLICLILLFQVVLRSRLGARWHYCLWLLLLIRMAMPWAPQSRLSVFNLIPQSLPQRQTEYARQEVGDDSADSDVADKSTAESTPVSTTEVAQDTSKAITVVPEIRKEAQGRLKPVFSEVANILPLIWLAGALILAVYVCANNFNLLRIVKRERPSTDQKILNLLEDCKAEMGIRIILGIVTTDKVKSPALFGFIRPRLLLPKGMLEALSLKELRHVFLHELAHLKRHDIYIGWLMSLLQVLHWFNPLIWLAFYRLRADRELACDALVLARTQSSQAKDYGRTIVNLLERFSRSQRLPAMAGILETKAQLKRRIKMIARFKKDSYQWSPLAVILIIILSCVSLPDAKHTKASETSAARPPRIVVRRVWADAWYHQYLGAPSPDGKYLAYSDWDGLIDGSPPLAVRELATGKTRRLTETGTWSPYFPIFSPDGKQVAYTWYTWYGSEKSYETKALELRIVGLDGSEPRVLHSDREGQVFRPADWSADGQHILAVLTRDKTKEKLYQIALVNVSDGSVRVVKTFDTFDPGLSMLKLSPDGRYIACSYPSAKGSSKLDIFLLRTDGTRETALVEHPADDRVLGWAPDGKRLVFTSDRTGSIGVWVIGVADGKPQGTAELVKPQMGKFYPLGLTRNGSLYYAVGTKRSDVHIATLDPETGKLLGSPVKAIQRFEGYNSAPEWSPDGRYLVCQSKLGLIIRELESGKIRILEPKLERLVYRSLRWSPDGRSLLGTGWDQRGRQGLLQIDVKTGDVTTLAEEESRERILAPEWAPDGKAVFYVRNAERDVRSTKPRPIVHLDLETRQEKELRQVPGEVLWLAVSPDGRNLAYIVGGVLKLLPTTGGELRELTEANGSCGITWTPDGCHLLFGRKIDEAKLELWRIPAQGGEPQKTGLTFDGWRVDVRMHPDGRRIAFASRERDKFEVWVMENFLPTGEGNER